jgi:hypothetical protein
MHDETTTDHDLLYNLLKAHNGSDVQNRAMAALLPAIARKSLRAVRSMFAPAINQLVRKCLANAHPARTDRIAAPPRIPPLQYRRRVLTI